MSDLGTWEVRYRLQLDEIEQIEHYASEIHAIERWLVVKDFTGLVYARAVSPADVVTAYFRPQDAARH